MTIYGVGYRRLDYRPTSWWRRLWPLATQDFLKVFQKKATTLLYALCFGVPLAKLVFVYMLLTTRDLAKMIKEEMLLDQVFREWADPEQPVFYLQHATDFGLIPFLVLTSLVSARTIAADRASNALELLWTRGVSPVGYFLARWFGSVLMLGSVLIGGPLVVWLMGISFAPDGVYFERTMAFMPQVLGALTVQVLILSLLAVAFSAVTRNPNRSTFLWFGLLLGTKALAEILNAMTSRFDAEDSDGPWNALSPWNAIVRVVRELSDTVPAKAGELGWSVLCIGVCVVLVSLLLLRRLRYREAVA